MDKDPAEQGESARAVLAGWLDDYSAGRCDLEDMQASFLSVCRSNPEAPWDALALLDQYQRRGRIAAELARTLKSEIAQLVFGVANQTDPSALQQQAEEDSEDLPTDPTASRWRQPPGENEDSGADRYRPLFDPAVRANEIDPHTRPSHTGKVGGAAGGVLRQRYELISILGRGSAGTAYKAVDRHRAHLPESSRLVAVKVLGQSYHGQPEALAQLERQFHQAQSLAHPNIVNVFDLDRDGRTYFLVMELLEGDLLATLLRQLNGRPLPRDRALGIVGAIGAALAHAHRRNVVHGDLKPRNVLITASGEVKVLDFGFSGRTSEPWVGDDDHGGFSAADTPAYASAEVVGGEEPEPGDDVYALACIAYELLAGRHPFGGRSGSLARAHGRKPQRIPGLGKKQWYALQRALGWTRTERRIEVAELVAALGCPEVPPQRLIPHELLSAAAEEENRTARWKWIAAAALLAVGVAGVFAYDRLRDLLPLPAITGSELPGVTQPDQESATAPAGEPLSSQAAPAEPVPEPAADTAPADEIERVSPPPQIAEPAPTVEAAPSVPERAAAAVPPRIEFEQDTYVVTKSDGVVRLTVRRHGSIDREAVFGWSLHGGLAAPGGVYAGIGPGTERIAAGARSGTLALPLVSDAVREGGTVLFTVELHQVDDGPATGAPASATVIIVDD